MLETTLAYRKMQTGEIYRIGEVNREEIVLAEYVVQRDDTRFGLAARKIRRPAPLKIAPWSKDGIQKRVTGWKPALEDGGLMYGAFDVQKLVGFVILGPKKPDRSGEIIALFIDRDYRRQGIAGELLAWAERKALALGMESLYVYANPTESSLSFYLKNSFEIVGLISKEIVGSLPGDIVMAKILPSNG